MHKDHTWSTFTFFKFFVFLLFNSSLLNMFLVNVFFCSPNCVHQRTTNGNDHCFKLSPASCVHFRLAYIVQVVDWTCTTKLIEEIFRSSVGVKIENIILYKNAKITERHYIVAGVTLSSKAANREQSQRKCIKKKKELWKPKKLFMHVANQTIGTLNGISKTLFPILAYTWLWMWFCG